MELSTVSIKEWLIATGYMEEKTDYILLNNNYSDLDNAILQEIREHVAEYYAIPLEQLIEDDIVSYHKLAMIKRLERRCQQEVLEGFSSASTGHIYRTNTDDQINILGKIVELMLKTDLLTIQWKTEDSGVIDHTRETFFGILFESIKHKEDKIVHLWQKKYEVSLCSTHEEINLIEW